MVAVPIGLLLGALCRSKGIQAAEAGWMSLLVNAGASQFAAVQLWANDGPRLGPILLSTLLINVRHALMSLTLVPKLAKAGMTRLRMCVALAFLTDPTWGFAEQRARAGLPVTWSYWMGLALVFSAAGLVRPWPARGWAPISAIPGGSARTSRWRPCSSA
ncbi:AzlC family ABC transporter permease [Variovorax sp. VRV01]|jgi:predicted branched-subunit amino acid permease|uniref:AzlC family ABC transporter permease n=1 Tax=Variovorax sp. VRV01 TaxID=2769259 RepID=UPI001783BEB2|nr:AzlC family ABC transporter permease [Variovorax sp. VRV01]MBD9663385.1 AzlC family ABC transporter permease [Variovorax sp. VRV01]